MSDNVIPIGSGRRAPRRPSGRRPAAGGRRLPALLESWELALASEDKSKHTIRNYLTAARAFTAYLADHDLPDRVEEIETGHIRSFIAAEIERTSASSAAQHQRSLSVLWRWLVAEGERTAPSPMAGIARLNPPAKAHPGLSDQEMAALLATCAGRSFLDRRDRAIMRLMYDSGPRVSGLVGMRYTPDVDETNDLSIKRRRVRIRLKGGRELIIPFGKKTAADLDRYLRARAEQPYADSGALWISRSGRLTVSGVRQMLKTRGEAAGVPGLHPHRFRRAFAHTILANGASVDTAMHLGGWERYDSMTPYTEDLAMERAYEAHDRLSPGDRI